MRLQSLHLEQFRNYEQLHCTLGESDTLVLVGENGAGKTNILEAISILSLSKSCLKTEEQDLMRWSTDFYRINGEVISDQDESSTIEIVSQVLPRKQKACFINDVKKQVSDVVGLLPSVIFLPQELELFTGSPANRRLFLDQLLCQVSSEYLRTLSSYQKVIKQRNTLLKEIAEKRADASALTPWNDELAEKGSIITLKRLELLSTLQVSLEEEIKSLGEQTFSDVNLRYERKSSKNDQQSLQQELQELLAHYTQRDVLLRATTVGPHRDDWMIEVDKRNLTTFASRGQQRTCVLALLLLEVSFLELSKNEKPIILLDDVFSELDDIHQESILRSLKGYQCIITATHIPPNLPDNTEVWKVKNGTIE